MTASQQRTGMQFLRAHGESILAMFGVSVALFFLHPSWDLQLLHYIYI